MTSTLLNDYKSKKACKFCGEHKVTTNNDEKEEAVVHYHCLACNRQFFETSELKEHLKQKDKAKKKKEDSTSVGVMMLLLMMAVVLAIVVTQQSESSNDLAPNGQIERIDQNG